MKALKQIVLSNGSHRVTLTRTSAGIKLEVAAGSRVYRENHNRGEFPVGVMAEGILMDLAGVEEETEIDPEERRALSELLAVFAK